MFFPLEIFLLLSKQSSVCPVGIEPESRAPPRPPCPRVGGVASRSLCLFERRHGDAVFTPLCMMGRRSCTMTSSSSSWRCRAACPPSPCIPTHNHTLSHSHTHTDLIWSSSQNEISVNVLRSSIMRPLTVPELPMNLHHCFSLFHWSQAPSLHTPSQQVQLQMFLSCSPHSL